MEEVKPKKIYTPENYDQAKQDFMTELKKLKDDFSSKTNVLPIIREKDVFYAMELID